MMITIIAAVSRNRAIGFENQLIYWLPNDLKRFKSLTTGHTIIMGRNTFESLPKGALPNRRNIVLSRSESNFPGCDTYASLEEALAHCKALGIPVLAGTDAGPNPMTPLGESLWRELGIYCEYGMTPVEALHAATAGAAAILGLADCTGSIRPGLAADLALFDGNPAEDITRLNTLCRTWQGGVQRFQH